MRYKELEVCARCGTYKLVGMDCLTCPVLDKYLKRG